MNRIAIAAVTFLICAAPVGTAATYYIDAAAGDDANAGTSVEAPWLTVEKANAALQPGDTVCLRAGVYNAQIAPRQDGTAEARITYAAYEGEKPEVIGGRDGSIVYLHNRSYVTLRGLKIHSPTEHDWVVRISGENATYNRLEACDVSDPQGYAPVVIAQGASYNEVLDCTVHDTGHGEEGSGDCIVMNFGAHHNTIRGNRCYNGCHSQIMALNGSHHNIIADNELYSTDKAWAGAGVNLPLGADGTTVTGNRIHDLGFITDQKCAIQIDSRDNVVANNVIYNVGAFGIGLQSYPFGTQTQEATGNLVANNTFYNTGRQAIFVVNKRNCITRDNKVANNIIVGSPADWYGHNAWVMVFDTYHLDNAVQPGAWFGNLFTHNSMFHGRAGEPDMVLYNHKGTPVKWSLGEVHKAFPETFVANVEVMPDFVEPASGDFRLKAGSPLFDAGVDVGLPYSGKAPDIGAFESEKAD